MNNDGAFQMRQLNEGDLEQFNALLRYAFQVTTNMRMNGRRPMNMEPCGCSAPASCAKADAAKTRARRAEYFITIL